MNAKNQINLITCWILNLRLSFEWNSKVVIASYLTELCNPINHYVKNISLPNDKRLLWLKSSYTNIIIMHKIVAKSVSFVLKSFNIVISQTLEKLQYWKFLYFVSCVLKITFYSRIISNTVKCVTKYITKMSRSYNLNFNNYF